MRDNTRMPMMPDAGTEEMNRLSDSSREDHIRAGAYERYLQRVRNGEPGHATADWLWAKRELRRVAAVPGKS